MASMKIIQLIRWKYVLPRLAAIVVVALFCRLALDGILHWAVTASSEAAWGAKVEIGQLRTSLGEGEIVLHDLALANPREEMHNTAEASTARLKIDVAALIRKRLVVTDGVVAGLQFGGERETSGFLPESPAPEAASEPSAFTPLVDAAAAQASLWFDQVAGKLEKSLTDELQTPAVIESLKTRWPAEYAALEARVEHLVERTKQLKTNYRQLTRNPLRNLSDVDELYRDMKSLEADLNALSAELNRLPEQMAEDRSAVETARAADEAYLREQLQLGTLDGAQLSKYLLDVEASRYLATAVEWIGHVRRLAPSKRVEQAELGQRGVNVLFIDKLPPKWLVEQIALSGHASLGGEPLKLTGRLTDLASDPVRHGAPIRIALTSTGAAVCSLNAELDRTAATPRDRLVLSCPSTELDGRQLGQADKFAIAMGPSTASVEAEITLEGDKLTGQIVVAQSNLRLTPKSERAKVARLTETLADALTEVKGFTTTVELAGTIKQPKWQIASDLGPQLAASLEKAAERIVREPVERALAASRAQVADQLAQLEAQRMAAQDKLLGQLGEHQAILAQLGPSKTRPGGGGLPAQIGKLPLKQFTR